MRNNNNVQGQRVPLLGHNSSYDAPEPVLYGRAPLPAQDIEAANVGYAQSAPPQQQFFMGGNKTGDSSEPHMKTARFAAMQERQLLFKQKQQQAHSSPMQSQVPAATHQAFPPPQQTFAAPPLPQHPPQPQQTFAPPLPQRNLHQSYSKSAPPLPPKSGMPNVTGQGDSNHKPTGLHLPRNSISVPPSRLNVSVFGVDPSLLPMLRDLEYEVPIALAVLRKTLYHLDGTQVEGVLRISGREQEMRACQAQLGAATDPETHLDIDVHSAATLIKRWYSELPGGFFGPAALSQADFEAFSNGSKSIALLSQCLKPPFSSLWLWLMTILSDIAKNEDKTKMGVSNISLVVAPALSPRTTNPFEAMVSVSKAGGIVTRYLHLALGQPM